MKLKTFWFLLLRPAAGAQKCQLEKLLSEVNAQNVYSNFI